MYRYVVFGNTRAIHEFLRKIRCHCREPPKSESVRTDENNSSSSFSRFLFSHWFRSVALWQSFELYGIFRCSKTTAIIRWWWFLLQVHSYQVPVHINIFSRPRLIGVQGAALRVNSQYTWMDIFCLIRINHMIRIRKNNPFKYIIILFIVFFERDSGRWRKICCHRLKIRCHRKIHILYVSNRYNLYVVCASVY